jgi:predicted dehydrogenase
MITRRRFLEESMIATAVAAAASNPRSMRAEETGKASANDTIRHAVIGCRIRGRVHAREFAGQKGVEVAYVCDPDRALAEERAAGVEQQQGRRPKAVQDLRTIFDDKSIDTVSIATPNHWHALAAVWAMQAGKDVYVEKPVSHNVVEGRRMVQAAEATGRLCQTGTQRRSSGPLAAAAKFIRQGKLGDVKFARSIIYGGRGSIGARGQYEVPSHIDYNLWLGPAPMTKLTRPQLHYDWHWNWDTGNGELGNNNIHIIDACRMLMGLTGLGRTVISIGGRLGYEDAGETPNTQIVAHDFDGATIVQEVRGLKSDPFSKQFKAGWIVHGTEGFVAEESLFDGDGKLVQTFKGQSENHFANFIKAVRGGRREVLNADIVEGHQSTSLCHLGNISYRVGRPLAVDKITASLEQQPLHDEVLRTFERMVAHLRSRGVDLDRTRLTLGDLLRIDDESESFNNHVKANMLLARSYRKPFELPKVGDFKRADS